MNVRNRASTRTAVRTESVMSNHLKTIVFTDLVKSTAVKSLLPGEDLEARNQAYLATIEAPHRQRASSLVSICRAAGSSKTRATVIY